MIQVRRLAGSPKTRACPMKLIRLRAKTTVRLQCRLSLSLTVTGLAAAACMIMGCFLPEAVSGKDGLARLLEKAETQVVARNLHTPWAMDFTPDGRILLTERPGRIRIVREDRLLPEAWMTLGDVDDELACGLLGLAVDPHFSSNRFVYAAYTYRTTEGHLRDRLVRLRERADGKGAVDRVLLEYGIPGGSQHHGGCVKFGPDGKLYWTTGDLGRPEISQDRSHLAGKILRLNPDGSVPSDNPFSESPVYSYGHRNPQGLAWQPGTRDLYVVDHGPSFRDELNRVEAGGNYGWPEITAEQSRAGMISPVLHSGISKSWAPSSAAFVTRGRLAGWLLFTGLKGQALYCVTFDPGDLRRIVAFGELFTGRYGRLRSVIQAPDGSIYFTTSNGDGLGKQPPGGEKLLRLRLPKGGNQQLP